MLETLVDGFLLVLAWPAPMYLAIGILVGLVFGAVPGLGGLIGFVLVLPFTFGMSPVPALALLLGAYAVTTTSDTLSSVLLGIPGTAASQATVVDGYPMTQAGEAARAFGAAFTVSAFGGVVGGLVLILSIPIIKPLILSFGSAEMFMLGVLGLTMVGSLSGRSVIKGLAAAGIGLLLSQIGYAGASGIPRYWFGVDVLLEGLPLIPVVLGLFALPELADLATRQGSISRKEAGKDRSRLLDGIRDAVKHRWLALRSAAIGAYVGMLPGLGGAIVDWVAYGHAVQSAKDKSRFGKGDVRGVIAPETANNAQKGGALVPTLAFGIPGDAAMAILLGALLIHGLSPGPAMLTTDMDVLMSMIWVLILANVIGACLLMLWSRQAAKLAFIPGHYIVPGAVLFVFMGAWMTVTNLFGWIILVFFGFVGLLMKRAGWPRPPLVLGFVLGPIMEQRYLLTEQVFGNLAWLGRPIVIVLIALTFVLLFQSLRGMRRVRREQSALADGEVGNDRHTIYTGWVSLFISGVVMAAAIAALIQALDWPYRTRLFPLLIAVPLIALTAATTFKDLRELVGQARPAATRGASNVDWWKPFGLLAALCGLIVLVHLIGQVPSILIFVFSYLALWARYALWKSALYTIASAFILIFLYENVLNVRWHQPLLF